MQNSSCPRHLNSRLFALAGAVVIALGAPDVHAQPTPEAKAMAETLFREARELMGQENYVKACGKFEESHRLDPALGTLLNMAVCHEKEGRVATAWGEFNEAAVVARREGRPDRVEFAKERVAALEPSLPRLTVTVAPEARVEGLEILRNGAPIGYAAWGTALPVDPGDVLIEARAPKHKPWSTSLTMSLKQQETVQVPMLEVAPEQPKPPETSGSVRPVILGPPPEGFWTPSRIAGVTLAGLGAATIAVGGFIGVDALRKESESEENCSGSICEEQRDVDLSKDALRNANIANVTIGAGALVGAVGVLLILTGGEATSSPEPGTDVSFTMSPWGTHGTSAAVRGTW